MAAETLASFGGRLVRHLSCGVGNSTVFQSRRLLVGLEQALLYILRLLHFASLAPLHGLLILAVLLSCRAVCRHAAHGLHLAS